MLKQYFEYKRNLVELKIQDPRIPIPIKNKFINEYNKLLETVFPNGQGPVLSQSICNEMLALAKEHKIPLVLDETDLGFMLDDTMPNSNNYKKEVFSNPSDVLLVHKSPVMPEDDQIKTPESAGATGTISFGNKEGICHEITYPVGNDTIHFTLNCPVGEHEYGNEWDSYKYAVITSLDKMDKSKILDVKPEDTYVDGNAEMGKDYYLFCPVGEGRKLQELNPNSIVIEYSGISLNEAIESLIIFLGKKLEIYGVYGWDRPSEFFGARPDEKKLNEMLEREQYPNLKGPFGKLLHSETKYMARRMWKREYEALINLLEYNKKNNIEMSDEELLLILTASGAYATPGILDITIDNYKEYVIPILEKYGYTIPDDFFEGLEDEPETKKVIIASPFDGSLVVDGPVWETELRNRTIKIIKEYQNTDTNNSTKKK